MRQETTQTDVNATCGHTHMRAQTHATAVTLTGCDSEESVSNVLLLDSLKDDG